MFDDYSLHLLAEIGIDVYLPRSVAEAPASELVAVVSQLAQPTTEQAVVVSDELAVSEPIRSEPAIAVDVLILCEHRHSERLLNDLLRALRAAGVSGDFADVGDFASISAARGLVVLGESIARTLGGGLSAQQQNAMTWIVAAEPASLTGNASAKRALWGEIKRLSRSLAVTRRSPR